MFDLRIVGALVALFFAFMAGWWINGTLWDSKYQTIVRVHAEEVAKAQKAARDREHELAAEHEQTEKVKDEKIRTLDTKLASALGRLRDRETRPSGGLPKDACPAGGPKGATGAQLFREDGEFLAREAARADRLAIELDACYSAYNAARKQP